jgi:hypothetical protein
MFLSKIIDGANIAAISTHFFGDDEKRYLDTDYLKKFILYTGLELISVESAMNGGIDNLFLQNITDMFVGIVKSGGERLAPIVTKYSVRELIPKVYTVSSTYRYLDSL